MTEALPPPAPPGLDAVWDAVPEARIVGGAVRDTLLGQAVADVDLASPLPPETVIARLKAAGLKAAPTGIAHGTVTAIAAHHGFEITTLRHDVETDGRHAVVAFTDDWQADAARRDFTINAMSMDRAGTVFDYFGGRADLAAGVVRFVGDAATRIEEDYLRILRFFRFFTRYARAPGGGAAAPDDAAVAAIRAHRGGLARLSAERVWSEVKRILQAPDPRPAITLMDATGVLGFLLPEGADRASLEALIARGAPADPILRLAALTKHAVPLKLFNEERGRLAALRRGAALAPDADDAALRRALAAEPADILIGRIWLGQDARPGWDDLRARIAITPRPKFPLAGRDAVAMGMQPGPGVGDALEAVRLWWLEGGCTADRAACLAKLRQAVPS